MMTYMKLGRFCALHVECAWALSVSPLFAKQHYNGEIIVDIPYCRLVYTPRSRVALREGLIEECCDNGKRTDGSGISCSDEGASEN